MALFHPVEAKPIIGLDTDGKITVAATVLAHVTQFGTVSFQVATWEAGRGQRIDYLSPADFESWRRSFTRPSAES